MYYYCVLEKDYQIMVMNNWVFHSKTELHIAKYNILVVLSSNFCKLELNFMYSVMGKFSGYL